MKLPIRQTATNNVKNAVNTMIKNISIIAVFVSLGVIALLYLGPEINFATEFVFRLAVPSIVLAISLTLIHELWLKNGRRSAFEETSYQDLLNTYNAKSDGLHYPTLQEFLDYERQRRYDVEYDRLTRLIERDSSLLEKLIKSNTHKFRVKRLKRKVRHLIKLRDHIQIFMPYEKSEEFDYLRYNLQDITYKEYAPSETKKHLTKARTKKYTFTITFTLIGFNVLSIGGAMGNVWVAIIMTILAAVAIMYSVVAGFSTGYHNIKVISTGVYNTGNSFLDQAVAYCKRNNKDLYYKGTTEFREIEKVIEPEQLDNVVSDDSIFTETEKQVAEKLFGQI